MIVERVTDNEIFTGLGLNLLRYIYKVSKALIHIFSNVKEHTLKYFYI